MLTKNVVSFNFNDLRVKVIYKPIKNTYLRINSLGEVCISTNYASSTSYLKNILQENYVKLSQRITQVKKLVNRQTVDIDVNHKINSPLTFTQLLLEFFQPFAKLGYNIPKLSIKKMRTRWGSYSAKTHRIHLNQLLLSLDIKFARYVIIHELCHLIEMNHSPRFYALMSNYQPDWRDLKIELNRFSYLLTK